MKIINFWTGLMLCTLLFTACQKQETNCRDGVLGNYTGTISTGGAPSQITTKINVGNNDKDVLLTIMDTTYVYYTFSGNLNADCTVLDIPNQNVGGTTNPINVNGTLLVNSTTINGTLIQPVGNPIVINCSK